MAFKLFFMSNLFLTQIINKNLEMHEVNQVFYVSIVQEELLYIIIFAPI